MNCSTAAATAATPCPIYGLGLSEVDDLAWLTDGSGQVVFIGTAAELLANPDLVGRLTLRQRQELIP